MKAVLCTKYGGPEVLKLSEVKKPVPKNDEVLVKIHTTAVTASDCIIRGLKVPRNPKFPKKTNHVVCYETIFRFLQTKKSNYKFGVFGRNRIGRKRC